MNNLKKFTTEAEYSAATLNYPAVSWVTSGDTVHFDKSGATPTVNDKVMMAFSIGSALAGSDIVMYNAGASAFVDYITGVTLNDVDVMSSINNGVLDNYAVADTDYLAKYDITNTTINECFSGNLGAGGESAFVSIDFLIPAQVTKVQSIPNNVGKLVIEAATPPTTSVNWSGFSGTIYVPDNAVSVYQTVWGGPTIRPISEYQGNLPV